MKNIRLTHIKTASKWAVISGVLALGYGSTVLGQSGNGGSQSNVTESTTLTSEQESPESSVAEEGANVMVNGVKIPTDKLGSSTVSIPGGTAHVQVSDGYTNVTTHSDPSENSSNQSAGNVNVNVDSHSSTSNSNSSGSNFNNTMIFSTDATSNVSVTP